MPTSRAAPPRGPRTPLARSLPSPGSRESLGATVRSDARGEARTSSPRTSRCPGPAATTSRRRAASFASSSPLDLQFPEHRPFAALDGNVRTAWVADRHLAAGRRWLKLGFERPRDVRYVDLVPYSDAAGVVREVEVAGRRFAVHAGTNR